MNETVISSFASIEQLKLADFIQPYRDLPSSAATAVDNIIDVFATTDQGARKDITERVARSFAFVFERYAHVAAVDAVRRGDPSLIKRGLVALAAENAKVDWRDTLPVVALLHNSALKLNLDIVKVFDGIAKLAEPPMRGIFESYSQEGKASQISAFRYNESGDGCTFDYVLVESSTYRIPSRTEWRIRQFFRKVRRRLS